MRALLIVAWLAIAARADADTIEIGKPTYGARVERVTLSLWVKEAELVGTLGLDLVGSDEIPREVALSLALPPGSRATAMELTGSASARATALEAGEARSYYHGALARSVEPALLEARGDALELQLYPIAKQATRRVVISLILPRASQLAVAPRGHTLGRLELTDGRTTISLARVTTPRGLALPAAPRGLFEPPSQRAGVDATTSLVLGRTSASFATPVISIEPQTSQCGFGGARILRAPIKLAMPRLRHCYERELLRDHTLAGVIQAQFLVTRAGKVEVKALTGTLVDPVVQACVGGVLASLDFPPSDGDTLINYPLTFRVAD